MEDVRAALCQLLDERQLDTLPDRRRLVAELAEMATDEADHASREFVSGFAEAMGLND